MKQDTPAYQQEQARRLEERTLDARRQIVCACIIACPYPQTNDDSYSTQLWANEVMHRANIIEKKLVEPADPEKLTQDEVHMILVHRRPIEAIRSVRQRLNINLTQAKKIVDAWRNDNEPDFPRRG